MFKVIKYELSATPQSYWDFIHEYGNLYQSKAYLEYYTASGDKSFVVAVFDGEELIGGTGITIRRTILKFPINVSTYFGPTVKDREQLPAVLESIADVIKTKCLFFSVVVFPEHVDILAQDPRFSDWDKRKLEFLHWNISAPMETFWKKLPKGKKAAINRAKREGVIIQEIETMEHVSQFQKVYNMSQIRGGITPTPQIYFENMIKIMKPAGLATGFLALHPETRQPIACVMLQLGWNKIARYFSVGHDYKYRNLGSTDFLMWHCLGYLKERGYATFDLMGIPTDDSSHAKGIRHFKSSWAGDNGHSHFSYTLTRGNFGLNLKVMKRISAFSRKVVK